GDTFDLTKLWPHAECPPQATFSPSNIILGIGLARDQLNVENPLSQARSKRSAFIILVHAATNSFTNFACESAQPYTSPNARSCECEPKTRSTRVPVHLSSSVLRSRPS